MCLALVPLLVALLGCQVLAPEPEWLTNYKDGVALVDRGETTKAQDKFKHAIELNPNLAEAHIQLGILYFNDKTRTGVRGESERIDLAEKENSQAVDILLRAKTTAIPGTDYEKVLSTAYGNLATTEVMQAQKTMLTFNFRGAATLQQIAMNDFRRALQHDPTNSTAREALNNPGLRADTAVLRQLSR